ncbi:FAD-dependent monooxygenase [Yoonia sediminilitoris]|uniref:2-polyprenyl-6-methoxyphenol hydroxylase-like FAD-dependent oxidoreductase n=1 Tax=Yoonia sediminilitoris TaxID=1286148 RepID=A0A2T6K8A1_9RHOB|nr:FAD-dependent monooxygenase [Yoonia sediminilitoris]PUB10914.1 2-polyprenyl-6-methoxyphenol hydroxylase-like FAD-dependent oxidoreductase [Yoonia sediminilitoris]RCW90589.1 2-polyprenyl-6-methoxyphenol hydroxylase-like FAD-dependent oxidoreductase [Yoonia sediminilitoris]
MTIQGLNVGVIGGSIAGCAAATALSRAGCNVEVFERSSKGLTDRGSGIAIPGQLRADLMERGYLPRDFPNCEMKTRWWQFPDNTTQGRRLWTQATPAFANNWGNLWRALRRNVPTDNYHEGRRLSDFTETETGVVAQFHDGEARNFDLLIGADGYHSVVRSKMHPQAKPEYAGYVLWRGNYPEAEVDDKSLIDAIDTDFAWLTVPFEGGHGVLYMIPDLDGSNMPGHRRVNWAVYAPCPMAQQLNGIESVPPGAVEKAAFVEFQRLLNDDFPKAIRDLIAHTRHEDVSIQPIYDSVVDTYTSDRTLLIGDAGTMARPHTASGATKALEDALSLEDLAGTVDDLAELLARYDAQRCAQAKTLSQIGRRIGRAQVLETPDWGTMSSADFEDWHKAIMSGDTLYLYGETA